MSFKPEVGQKCKFKPHRCASKICTPKFLGKHICVLETEECAEECYYLHMVKFEPIQTESDKQRDEQIDSLYALKIKIENDPSITSDQIYDEGYRFIAPDGYIVKALTDEQVDSLRVQSGLPLVTLRKIIDAVQHELGIEV